MAEKLDVYNLKGVRTGSQDRDEFYREAKREYKETGKITKQLKTVRVQLMSPDGRLYLQKRSKTKKENPGLYDKTVGGHVHMHDSYPLTVVKECEEELGFPAIVLPEDDFKKAIGLIDLDVIGIFREVEEISKFMSTRKTKTSMFVQPYITAFFVGYYEGSIRFRDGEASGIETFSLEEIQEDLEVYSERYTDDLKFMIDRYAEYLVPLKQIV